MIPTKIRFLERSFIVVFVLLIALLLTKAFAYEHTANLVPQEIHTIDEFTYELGDENGTAILPYSFNDLPPRTKVTLHAVITPEKNDCLYVKSVYAPLRLYADDQLIYESGKPGSFPEFLIDPPTLVSIVPLIKTDVPLRLRLEYLSPSQRTILTMHPLLLGPSSAIFYEVYFQYIFSFILSMILISLGIVAIMGAVALLRVEAAFASFLWLGIFSCTTGMWILGECNLTAFFIPYPAFLYIIAFVGLFYLVIPLLKFGFISLNLRYKKYLAIMLSAMQTVIMIATFLQLLGIVSFSRSMYLFHIVIPVMMLIFSACILWDALRFKNVMAQRFFFPTLVLTFATVLEVLNYQFRFTYNLSFFFQLGVLLFTLSLVGVGACFVRDAIRTQKDKHRLEFELKLKEQQVELQKSHHAILTQNAAATRSQRHDLRHQLAVIRHYNDLDDKIALDAYLNELSAKIPTEKDITFCENSAANAVTLYYVTIARQENISISVQFCIPAAVGRLQDSDICVIIGNFLENAIEACRLIDKKRRFIKVYANIRYDSLILAMDNSFNGQWAADHGQFLSQKRSGYGTGLSSVKAVAEKYDGTAKFEVNKNVFSSSVYLPNLNIEHTGELAAKENDRT